MAPERYFILIYNIPSRALEIHEFESDYEAAADAYTDFEAEHRGDRSVEVVLVGADSIDTIKKTHSHYFAERADDLFQEFLEGVAPVVEAGGGRVLAETRPRRRRRSHKR